MWQELCHRIISWLVSKAGLSIWWIKTRNMASARKKGLYEEDDRVEEFLVNQVAKFIRYEKLTLLAKDLKIKERELEIIMAPNYLNPHGRIAKVSK